MVFFLCKIEVFHPTMTDFDLGASTFGRYTICGKIESLEKKWILPVMTPDKQERIEACIQELATLLYEEAAEGATK